MSLMTEALDVLPKDYLETPEGLVFAVLSATQEAGRIPAYLRYRRQPEGGLLKLSTPAARACLEAHFKAHLFWSPQRGRILQGLVPSGDLICHRALSGRARLKAASMSPIRAKALALIDYLEADGPLAGRIGLTGSLLLGAEGAGSDIDLVVYRPDEFDQARGRVLAGLASGVLERLTDEDWRSAHARRETPLSLEAYRFHETRKGNKARIGGVKFDLSLQDPLAPEPEPVHRSLGPLTLRAKVTDAREAFGFPARYRIEHPTIQEVLAFTQTYVGQALEGEWIEACGTLERTLSGVQRLVVGTDRESRDQYILTFENE